MSSVEEASGVGVGVGKDEDVESLLQVREDGVHSAGRSDKDSEAPKG